ncbi:DUF881 domain-containing protein [Proteiniclasticum sp.]|uniref:DUF881 domain-containing protein n=1 Tax=Proteiniclasticum sp. TaxID=2053595 RepID=UPI0025EA73A2|nr:DUF881 domain-containing protein [Proteiniclasticum sp.]
MRKVSVFIGSVVIGMGLSVMVSLVAGKMNLYKVELDRGDKVELRNSLRSEIERLKEENLDYERKLEGYRENVEDFENIYEELKLEYRRNSRLLGYESVQGEGIILTMRDGKAKDSEVPGSMESWLRIIHNEDMLKLLNELNLHGAETIEINGQRVTETSEIFCSGAFISINGEKLPAPFVLKVVGDRELLDPYTANEYNQIANLQHRGIEISVEKRPIMTLDGSIDEIFPLYLEESNE